MKANSDRIIELFGEAMARPSPDERARFLAEACRDEPEVREQVESLLRAEEPARDFLKQPPPGVGQPAVVITEKPGDRIGRYKLLERIGEGGCGVVYMAEQEEPVRRRVALKVIKLGMDTKQVIARFEAERQALALMDHSNIAKVHDGGATDTGRPYFVMELVRGLRITDYCDQNHLPTAERLKLFVQVCQAIQHAHQKGIIHRDIKPSNILVTVNDGVAVPKVIDFGIAKATDQRLTDKSYFTGFQSFIGTPAYTSPEQAEMSSLDVDTRSDIYSLGVLLYELLTGQTPFDADQLLRSGLDEMRRIIREEEPATPSTRLTQQLERGSAHASRAADSRPRESAHGAATDSNAIAPATRPDVAGEAPGTAPEARALPEPRRTGTKELIHQLRGDLDWIVMKCLEKDRARRYETAIGLAADIQRHLNNETVLARPASTAYRFRKLVRRNKPAFAAVTAVAGVLLLGAVVSTWQAVEASRARDAEKQERVRAEKGELAARTSELAARQFAYASDMNLAQQAVQEDDFYRALQLLDRHRPAANPLRSSRREEAHSETRNAERGMGNESQSLLTSAATDLRGWEWRYLWRQCQGEERFILGEHTNGATAVGLLADGKTVFSAGRDKLVRLWDLESRRQIGLLPHAEEVIGAAASPDGRWLATASRKAGEGQPVLLWDLATQKIATNLTTEFRLRPGSITFSPDSKWLAFTTVWGGVRVWDVKARSEVTNLPASNALNLLLGLAFSPDSRTLAYNENDYGAILLWDTASRSVTNRLIGHQGAVTALAFSRDGQTLASGSRDRTARLWNLTERRERLQFTNHSGGFTTLAFSSDGRTLAMSGAGGAGRVIRVVEIETGGKKAELRGPLQDVSSLAFTPEGQTLLSASDDGTLRVWDLVPRAKEKTSYPVAPDLSTAWNSYGPALCLSPDGRHLLTVYTNQTFSLWDTLRLVEGERHPLPFTNTTSAAVAPAGRRAAFASRSGEVMLWDADTGQARFFAQPGTNQIHRLVFSLDGRSLATADNAKPLSQMSATNVGRTVRVWDVAARKETHVFSAEGGLPMSLTFSADARALMVGSWKGSVQLWPLDSPGQAATFPGHSGSVGGLAMLPDGQTVISAAREIRFWDVQTRHENALKLSPRAGEYDCLALSPDGRRFAAGAGDGRITIWDVASHQEVATLEGHQESVTQLAFTPDGDHLVSAGKDQLRVWRAPSWAEIEALPTRKTQPR